MNVHNSFHQKMYFVSIFIIFKIKEFHGRLYASDIRNFGDQFTVDFDTFEIRFGLDVLVVIV